MSGPHAAPDPTSDMAMWVLRGRIFWIRERARRRRFEMLIWALIAALSLLTVEAATILILVR